MDNFVLRHAVRNLDNQLLFPPGATVTEEMLSEVIRSNKIASYETCALISYGSIKEDFLSFIKTPPYQIIFHDSKETNDLLTLTETVQLSMPVLQSLDYFKRYDFHTYAHILMVFALSTLLAKDLIPDFEECIRLSATGPTHDIGKICVPLNILKKTTPLTRHERSFIEHHSAAGFVLLRYYSRETNSLSCKVAAEHHERRDGSGYPEGITLRDPLVEIIAVSDVYDALIKPRPYRSAAYENRAALEEVTEMAEQNKFGWDAVRALVAHNRTSKPHFKEISISREKRGTPPSHNVYGIVAEEESDPKSE